MPDRGRRVRPPHDAGPEGARLVGHAVLDPEAGQEDDVREAGHDLQVRVEPRAGVEEEVERVQAGEPRHPGAVHDEGHRDPLRHAPAGGGQEVLPVLCHMPLSALKPPSTGIDRPRDERGGVAAQPDDRALQLGGVAEASHRGAGQDLPRALGGRAVLPEERRPVLLRDEEARGDRVDPQPLAEAPGEVHRHPPREALDRGLGHGVAEDPAQREGRRHRRDVHDAPLALPRHRLAEHQGRVDRAVQVQPHDVLVGGERHLERGSVVSPRLGHVAASGVHEDVHPAPLREERLPRGHQRLVVQDVGHEAHGRGPRPLQGLGLRLGRPVVPAEDHDPRPGGPERLGHAAPEDAVPPGHDGDASLEVEHAQIPGT